MEDSENKSDQDNLIW